MFDLDTPIEETFGPTAEAGISKDGLFVDGCTQSVTILKFLQENPSAAVSLRSLILAAEDMQNEAVMSGLATACLFPFTRDLYTPVARAEMLRVGAQSETGKYLIKYALGNDVPDEVNAYLPDTIPESVREGLVIFDEYLFGDK